MNELLIRDARDPLVRFYFKFQTEIFQITAKPFAGPYPNEAV